MYIEMFSVMKHVYILYFFKYINKNYKRINEYIYNTYTCDITGRYISAPEWAGIYGSLLKDPRQWYFSDCPCWDLNLRRLRARPRQ